MADYKLTLADKETIILWSEADDTVRIDTFSQKLINRLHKAKEKAPELYRVDEPDKFGGVYAEVPKHPSADLLPHSDQRCASEEVFRTRKRTVQHPRLIRGSWIHS